MLRKSPERFEPAMIPVTEGKKRARSAKKEVDAHSPSASGSANQFCVQLVKSIKYEVYKFGEPILCTISKKV